MPSLYDDIGKYGEASQGRPTKAKHPGRCTACGGGYAKGAKVLRLDDSGRGTHPRCAYSDVVESFQALAGPE